jgi:hypothetical protein
MIISTKGVSVTAARRLIDDICGDNDLPLFVLHDFDVAGFMIFGTLQRDTRRFQFTNSIEVIDLGLRLEDIEDLEQEPAAASRTDEQTLRNQLAENGATDAEIDILIDGRVELNAMTSDDLIEMIERKLGDYGLQKVIPDDDLLAQSFQAFHHSQQLRKLFEKAKDEYEEADIDIPDDLREQVSTILDEHDDLRWDDAVQIVLDDTQLDHVREKKQEAREKSGDFTDDGDDDEPS